MYLKANDDIFRDILYFLDIARDGKQTEFVRDFSYKKNDSLFKLNCISKDDFVLRNDGLAKERNELYRLVSIHDNVIVEEQYFILIKEFQKVNREEPKQFAFSYGEPIPLKAEDIYIPEVIDLETYEITAGHYKTKLSSFKWR